MFPESLYRVIQSLSDFKYNITYIIYSDMITFNLMAENVTIKYLWIMRGYFIVICMYIRQMDSR